MKKLSVSFAAMMLALAAGAETIAYWPFGANGLKDVSGNGYDLTADGDHVTASVEENCIVLDGQQTFFETIDSLVIPGSDMTIECWAQFSKSEMPGAFMFFEYSPNCNNYEYGFYLDYGEIGNKVQSTWRTSNYMQTCEGNDDLVGDGEWHHIAVVFHPSVGDISCNTLYIDGENVFQGGGGVTVFTSTDIDWPSYKLFLGLRSGKVMPMAGKLDDVRISSGCLDPSEFVMRSSGALPINPRPTLGQPSVTGVTTNSISIAVPVIALGDGATGCDVLLVQTVGESVSTNKIATLDNPDTINYTVEGLPPSTVCNFTIQIVNDIVPDVITRSFSVQTAEPTRTIAYWKFDEESAVKGDDGALRLNDESGNGNTLVIKSANLRDGALRMNGGQEIISTASAVDHLIGGAVDFQTENFHHLTVELWVKFSAADNPSGVILLESSVSAYSTPGSFYLYYEANKLYALVSHQHPAGSGNYSTTAVDFVPDGEWHHIAMVVNPDATLTAHDSCADIYIDGRRSGQIPWSDYGWAHGWINFYSQAVYVGNRANNALKFVGEIDDVRLTAGALDPIAFVARTPSEGATYPQPGISKVEATAVGEDNAEFSVTVDTIGDGASRFDMWAVWTAGESVHTNTIVEGGTESGIYPFSVSGLTESSVYAITVMIRNDVYDETLSTVCNIATREAAKIKAYWSFDGEPVASSGGGGSLYFNDETGGYSLIVDGVTFANGAACFDGTLSNVRPSDWQYGRINFGNVSTPSVTQATIEGWARFSASDNAGKTVVLFGTGDYGGYEPSTFLVYYDEPNAVLGISMCYETNYDVSYWSVPFEADGKWHHIAIVLDMNETTHKVASLYVDYEKLGDMDWRFDGTRYHGFALSNPTFHIGTNFTGQIDDVRVYNRALAPSQFVRTRTKGYSPFVLILR
ncbi:MAG: LamG domain-containing protein [Kiritimatiellae bacterium]|nr:LamG domain-containing protein [Kiritimatiellia bacterium]